MYTQSEGYGCGMYSVANALNLSNYATDERLAESKKHGNLICHLNDWIKEDGHGVYLQPLFYDTHLNEIPKSWYDLSISGEVLAMPLIFCVTLTENGLSHMIAGQLDKEGRLFIKDSLKLHEYETTIKELSKKYHSVFGMYAFCDCINGNYAFIG